MRVAPVKSAATAAANYGTNAGSPAAANAWAANLSADLPAVFNAAKAQVNYWQTQVASPQSATNYVNGLNTAAANITAIQAKINGPSKTTYTTQVKASAAAGGKYANFAAAWQPAVTTEIATLDRTNPSGDYAANVARMTAFVDWAHSQAGKFKQ